MNDIYGCIECGWVGNTPETGGSVDFFGDVTPTTCYPICPKCNNPVFDKRNLMYQIKKYLGLLDKMNSIGD